MKKDNLLTSDTLRSQSINTTKEKNMLKNKLSILTKDLEKDSDKLKWYDFVIALIPGGLIIGIIHLIKKRHIRGEVIIGISILEMIVLNYLNKIIK